MPANQPIIYPYGNSIACHLFSRQNLSEEIPENTRNYTQKGKGSSLRILLQKINIYIYIYASSQWDEKEYKVLTKYWEEGPIKLRNLQEIISIDAIPK